jgi:hypothetical protein
VNPAHRCARSRCRASLSLHVQRWPGPVFDKWHASVAVMLAFATSSKCRQCT